MRDHHHPIASGGDEAQAPRAQPGRPRNAPAAGSAPRPETRSPARDAASAVRTVLVEDHAIVRESIRLVLDGFPGVEVCGEADSVRSAIETVSLEQPDLVLLDLLLGSQNAVEYIKDIRTQAPHTRVLVLSMLDQHTFLLRALRCGACGFVSKSGTVAELARAIQCVMNGETYLSPAAQKLVDTAGEHPADHPVALLTDREVQIFQLIGYGHSTREIAKTLSISPKTVEAHKENIKTKLGFPSAAALIRSATRWTDGLGRSGTEGRR